MRGHEKHAFAIMQVLMIFSIGSGLGVGPRRWTLLSLMLTTPGCARVVSVTQHQAWQCSFAWPASSAPPRKLTARVWFPEY